MSVADILELYDYDRWANAKVLDIAATLSDEERHRELGASYGSVFGTLAHILWAEWRWLGRWRPGSAGPDPLTAKNLSGLRRLWTAFEAEQKKYLSALNEADLGRSLTYENPPGTRWTYSFQHMLQHVVNHSTYHRGQLTSLFRALGATPAPLDFLEYFDEK